MPYSTLRAAAAWLLALPLLLTRPALAQQVAFAAADTLRPAAAATVPADTTRRKYATVPGAPRKPWYKGKLLRASVVPAMLIGYGVSVYNDHGFYSSIDARRDIQRNFPHFNSHLDNYGQYFGYAELAAVLAFGVESRNDRTNLALLVVKSEALMLTTVAITKYATHHERPDGSDNRSFPSGHTAQAFLAASIVHTELRHKSQWYGIGAYTVAAGVGAFRMLNNRHWESDVFAGAGVGILSAHLAYLSHRHRWGRHPLERDGVGALGPARPPLHWQLSPTLLPGNTPGFCASWTYR